MASNDIDQLDLKMSHTQSDSKGNRVKSSFLLLTLGSVGVVYGDIGTSPLYAFREALKGAAPDGITAPEILGVVSLALWALILVVTIKYVFILMFADNKGEGGVLALQALAQKALGRSSPTIFVLGVIGAALFYGDAVITPAISVLSAVEGLKTIPSLEQSVNLSTILLISAAIMVSLFAVQFKGTASVAAWFGPICALWFVSMAVLGIMHLSDDPRAMLALNPYWGLKFLSNHGLIGFMVLGAVFLTVTGAEALYADMGHFGRKPIQTAWIFLVLPCLALNYLGQGAFALSAMVEANAQGKILEDMNFFFLMCPESLRPALVILATIATVIASQAVITGAFSLTQQAIQLGLLPRMQILRTSETQSGQIFLPSINMLLLLGVLTLIILFQTSSNLAHAYGIAVTGTMIVTSCLLYIVMRRVWKWRQIPCLAIMTPLFLVELSFLSANLLKIPNGGWFPLVMGGGLFIVMWTWTVGTRILTEKTRRDSIPLRDLLKTLMAHPPHRVAGTAIFLTSDPALAPVALMHNLKHNKVLHEKIAILTVRTAETPRVPDSERVEIEDIGDDVRVVTITYGFMESPNIPKALTMCRKQGLKFDIMATSFFLGHRTIVASSTSGMPLWQDHLYIFLSKNATNATDFFHIPSGRVVELGTQVVV
ncbi:potassium transporter Kup [Candidatus Phycosocius spiralis]|uniref:Probable potassium transport system protein Kup n=1 Tax=Candidatus Phycosocius spiralis TaxID=2815099 RepID=A0ABQ4PTU1_9PROT|nr:putative potassium transport system protein kup [Candidatus Phycosocius spiralis]